MSTGNIKKFELKLGRTGIIITVSGMAVLLCVSFVLGVTVGKNIDTYPEKISSTPQRILAFFWRPAKVAVTQGSAEIRNESADQGNIDLTFHNSLTNSKTLPIQPQPAVEKAPEKEVLFDQKAVPQVPSVSETSKESATDKKESAPSQTEPVKEKATADHKADKKKDEAAVLASTGASYFIHVASLKDKNKADQINKTIVGLGYKSKVVKTDVKGKGIWYRVVATGFETRVQAQAAVGKISKKVRTTCIIRQTGTDAEKN